MWQALQKLIQTFNMTNYSGLLLQHISDFLVEQGYAGAVGYASINKDEKKLLIAKMQATWQESWSSHNELKNVFQETEFLGYIRTCEALQQIQASNHFPLYEEVLFFPLYFRQKSQGVLMLANKKKTNLLEDETIKPMLCLTTNLLAAHLSQVSFVENSGQKPEKPNFSEILVLVVEDVLSYQIIIGKFLAALGAKFEVAGTGKVALQKLKEKTFDLVLMDIQLPDADGFELAKTVRKELKLTMPIVAMTAEISDTVKQNLAEKGINSLLTKPVQPSKLQEILKTIPAKKNKAEEEIDIEFLAIAANNNAAFMQNMLKMTITEFRQFDLQFVEAWQQTNLETIKRLRHKIKPHLETYKLDNLHKILNHLVWEAEQGNFAQEELLKKLRAEMDRICQLLNEKASAMA
jgi:CheY-like chemotaxis protein